MPATASSLGDPARSERITARFDSSEETIRNREFLGFRGTVGGVGGGTVVGIATTRDAFHRKG